MIATNLFDATDAHEIINTVGRFSLLEYKKDYSSVTAAEATKAYFAAKMNVHKRQVIIEMNNDGDVILQAGAMQMIMGPIHVTANQKGGMFDLLKKYVGSKVTKETMFKPKYSGRGVLVLEPTYNYIMFQDLDDWNGSMVIEDGMFLACDASCDITVTARGTVSSAVLGNEGLFNTTLRGSGVVALECPAPQEELIIADLEDDEIRIDGDMAIAWSSTLDFTVEKTTDTLIGSAVSGEGLVNVYRGTGRVLIAPIGKHLRETKNNVGQTPPATEPAK